MRQLIAFVLLATPFSAAAEPFTPGHASSTVEGASVARRADGFVVQFKARSPVATPSVTGDRVIVGSGFSGTELYAFDRHDGTLRWGMNLGDNGPSTPACEDGICTINTESCTIYGFDAHDGKLLWSWVLGSALLAAPSIHDGRVFASFPTGPGGYTLAAFDLRHGGLLWRTAIDDEVVAAPVAADDNLYAVTFAGTLYRLDLASGATRAMSRGRALAAPTIVGADLFVARADAGGTARVAREDRHVTESHPLEGAAVKTAVPFARGQSYQGLRVLRYRGLALFSDGNDVVAADAASGAAAWRFSGAQVMTPPVAAGDRILVATLAGDVLVLDPRTGKVQRSFAAAAPVSAQPVVEGGWIYLGTQDGKLVAIDSGDRSLGGWPQWGRDAGRSGSVAPR